jgi:hypothetical protein
VLNRLLACSRGIGGPLRSLSPPDPTSPRSSAYAYAEITEWLDEYDPVDLDVLPIQVALGRIAARRDAAAKRIIKPAND